MALFVVICACVCMGHCVLFGVRCLLLWFVQCVFLFVCVLVCLFVRSRLFPFVAIVFGRCLRLVVIGVLLLSLLSIVDLG